MALPTTPQFIMLGIRSFLSAVLSVSALGLLSFSYSALLLSALGVIGEQRDLTLFIVGTVLLPPFCAAVQIFLIRPNSSEPISGVFEAINIWAAVTLLVALSALPLMMYFSGKAADFWPRNAQIVVVTIAGLHGIALVGTTAWFMLCKRAVSFPTQLMLRSTQDVAFATALFFGCFALFWIDPTDRYFNFFVRLYFSPPFSESPAPFRLGPAALLATALLLGVAVLAWFEAKLLRKGATVLQATRRVILIAAVVITPLCFFDFSLNGDVLHYLTNVAPALHVLHGGTPMVDVYSQYGPGPVLATLVGFMIGPTTFGTAQITVQVFNLAFYALWLVCLYRMSPWKLPALLLGLLSIAVFFSLWNHGFQNVNDAPSILGLRYVPTLGMVLALSCLRSPQRFSSFTALSTFVAGMWSVETLIGTVGIHAVFLGFLAFRERAPLRLVADGIKAVLPAVCAVAAMALAALMRAGTFPDFGAYLEFLAAYNMSSSSFWSYPIDPMFFGWLAMLLAIFLVLADAWMRVFDRVGVTNLDEETLFYRFVPMAMLLMLQASYFVGRSVDYTLDIALLPFCAIVIPAGLAFAGAVSARSGPIRVLLIIPVAIGFWALTFTSLSLLRQNYSTIVRPCAYHARCESAPYSLYLHECRDHDRCTPAAVARALNDMVHKRAVVERVGNPRTDWAFDTHGVIKDALSMIDIWAKEKPAVTVLIGHLFGDNAGDDMASDVALMYSGKWHRWPRSSTASDGLVPSLAQRIIASPIELQEGELVLVRRSAASIGKLESGILERIKARWTLCQLQHPSKEIIPYRVAGPAGCRPE